MRLATLLRNRTEPPLPGLHGTARVARSTPDGATRGGAPSDAAGIADLARRVRPGDIAVLHGLDLDAASARLLASAGASAVVNAAPCVSGRYPARGAQVLVDRGVAVLDRVGPEVMRVVRDGDRLRLDGPLLHRGDDVVARGEVLTADVVTRLMDRARAGLAVQLESFAANTAEHLRHEGDLLLDGDGVPAAHTVMAGRPVLVVAGGPGWRDDLDALRAWVRHTDPVLVGVDEGADALTSVGLRPNLLVGNPDLMSEQALLCGAEVVVRVDRDPRVDGDLRTGGDSRADRGSRADRRTGGADRAQALGARTVVFPVTGTSEDAALLLVHAHDPAMIVSAGSRAAVADFVDRGRADLAGTFLTRLKVADRLVDAATVARVFRAPAPTWPLWLLVLVLLAGVVAIAVLAGDTTPVGQLRADVVTWVREVWDGAT